MKTIIYILIGLILSTVSLKSSEKKQLNQVLNNSPSITLLSETSLSLGTYYPESIEQLYNKNFEFMVEGINDEIFFWEISELINHDVELNTKYYGSADGYSWTEITQSGTTLLNENGNYYFKIEILQVEVKTEVTNGMINNYYTITVEY